jgi:hypothetical protein
MAAAAASGFRSGFGLLLLRLLVGWVFLSEGIQKFMYPAALGAGRFEKIGIPYPHFTGPFCGSGRDCLRSDADSGNCNCLRGGAAADRRCSGDCENEGADDAGAGNLGGDA